MAPQNRKPDTKVFHKKRNNIFVASFHHILKWTCWMVTRVGSRLQCFPGLGHTISCWVQPWDCRGVWNWFWCDWQSDGCQSQCQDQWESWTSSSAGPGLGTTALGPLQNLELGSGTSSGMVKGLRPKLADYRSQPCDCTGVLNWPQYGPRVGTNN